MTLRPETLTAVIPGRLSVYTRASPWSSPTLGAGFAQLRAGHVL